MLLYNKSGSRDHIFLYSYYPFSFFTSKLPNRWSNQGNIVFFNNPLKFKYTLLFRTVPFIHKRKRTGDSGRGYDRRGHTGAYLSITAEVSASLLPSARQIGTFHPGCPRPPVGSPYPPSPPLIRAARREETRESRDGERGEEEEETGEEKRGWRKILGTLHTRPRSVM